MSELIDMIERVGVIPAILVAAVTALVIITLRYIKGLENRIKGLEKKTTDCCNREQLLITKINTITNQNQRLIDQNQRLVNTITLVSERENNLAEQLLRMIRNDKNIND